MKHKNGFIQLVGLAVSLAILSLYVTLVLGSSQPLSRHQAVDRLVRDLVLDMEVVRQHSMGNSLGKDYCKLILKKDNYVLQHLYWVKKKRPYPPGLRVTKGMVQFDVYGRPKYKMVVVVASDDERYERRIIVAAQTGRIRIE
ncbi:hypothetical protein [uncultured Megasphaera sp.]|uniref:hypothetical protein n=1 Tax=Megasphaera massiliensis TaxID=1232428 RepID=UPI00266D6D36|nr:hypothetical protein [uncultured Megasphaera sp.]